MALSPIAKLSQNPIAQAEFRHQRFLIQNGRNGIGWILLAVGMLLPAFLTGIIYFFTAIFGIEMNSSQILADLQYASVPQQLLSIGTMFLLTMNIALYFVVIMITVALAANSISREKRSRTWDTLLLTNIDARKIVMGKWWASLRAIFGDHTMILWLRLGLVGFFIHTFDPVAPAGFTVLTAYLIPLTVFAVLFTVADAIFTAALGIAIPLSNLSGAVMGAIVLNVKLATIIGSGGLVFLTALQIHNNHDLNYIPLLLVALIGYLFLTWVMLHVAQIIAIRGQVSAPSRD